jgi:hypothetical protein
MDLAATETALAREAHQAGRVAELRPYPFTRRVKEFRTAMGYSGPLFDADAPPVAAQQAPGSLWQRREELVRLLEMPACPRPETAFEAYCLVFQLMVAVDNRHFGPFNLKAAAADRLGTPTPSRMIELAGEPQRVCIPTRVFNLVVGSRGGVELRVRSGDYRAGDVRLFPRSADLESFPALVPDAQGAFRSRQLHAQNASARVKPQSGASKRERVARFLSALAEALPAGDPLEAMAGLNLLLESMERAHFGPAPASPNNERLYSVLPFSVHASPAFPGAALLLSAGHVIAYYADGRIEIHERDRLRDIRTGGTLVSITLRQRVAVVPARLCITYFEAGEKAEA